MVGDSKHCRVGTGLGIKCAGTGGVREITNPVQASTLYTVCSLLSAPTFLWWWDRTNVPVVHNLLIDILHYSFMRRCTRQHFSLFHQSQTYSAMNTIIFQSILANGRHVLQTYLPERPNIFRLDALALSVVATATWLAGWLGGCLSQPVLYQND